MKYIRKQSGFSAVELLITLFVASVFLLTGFQLYAVIIKNGGDARQQANAANVAADYLQKYASSATNPCTTQSPLTNYAVPGQANMTLSVSIQCPFTPNVKSQTSAGATGGTITYTDSSGLNPRPSTPYAGGYVVHTFTSSGTFVQNTTGNAEVLVVGGGGGSSASRSGTPDTDLYNNNRTGGGGGGGGVTYNSSLSIPAGSYAITVGNGGPAAVGAGPSSRGETSSIGALVSVLGGGFGGMRGDSSRDYGEYCTDGEGYPEYCWVWGASYSGVGTGGSGGGGHHYGNMAGGVGTAGQGNTGGNGYDGGGSGPWSAGGGGGKGAAGSNGLSTNGGNGGGGLTSTISGTSTCYGGGGGGGIDELSNTGKLGGTATCGNGIGGRDASPNGTPGTINTGGGAGGGGGGGGNGATGGKGIVIIKYPYTAGSYSISSVASYVSKIVVKVKYGNSQQTLINSSYVSSAGLVTKDLALNLDAGSTASYPGTGTTWTDLSSNAISATLNSGVSYSAANSGTLLFNGSSGLVNAGNSPGLDISGAITLDGWVKLSSTATNQTILLKANSGGNLGSTSYGLAVNAGGAISNVMYSSTVASNFVTGSSYVSAGNWYNIVSTWDGSSTISIYVNGTLVQTFTKTDTLNSNTQTLSVGSQQAVGNYLNGNIGAVKIYNRALTSNEVQQNFSALRNRYGI